MEVWNQKLWIQSEEQGTGTAQINSDDVFVGCGYGDSVGVYVGQSFECNEAAAVSGVAARYLSREDVDTVAVIGPGAMARHAMQAFLEVRPQITTVKIKGRSAEGVRQFIQFCKEKFPQIQHYQVCSQIQEACEGSDLIYFGTTNAQVYEENPTIKEQWIKKGALVISVSALLTEKRLLASPHVKLVADHYRMYEDWERAGKDQYKGMSPPCLAWDFMMRYAKEIFREKR